MVLRDVCEETRFLAEVRAILWFAQYMRLIGTNGSGNQRVSAMLPSHQQTFDDALGRLELESPKPSEVLAVLHRYDVLTEVRLKSLWVANEQAIAEVLS